MKLSGIGNPPQMEEHMRKYPKLPGPVNDFGGRPAEPIAVVDHDPAPWEKRTHATLECLYWRGAMSMEEKRAAIEDLGLTMYGELTYYEKWITGAARRLLAKGLITQDELDAKLADVRARTRVRAE